MSDIQNLEIDLDLKENLLVTVTCKQLDNLNLIFNIWNNSVQADLSNYRCRLKALKQDQIPLIQNTDITINNNVVTVVANEQLTTTSGNVKTELQFIDKTTGEKKSTFSLNLKVIASVLEADRTISKATITLLEELDNKLDEIEDIGDVLDEAITVKSELKTDITTANTAKGSLNTAITSANTKEQEIETSISNANSKITEVATSITNANTIKSELDTSKTNADKTKENLDSANLQAEANIEALSQLGDVTQIAQDVTDLKSEVETARGTETNLDARLDKFDTDLSKKVNQNIALLKENIEFNNLFSMDSEGAYTSLQGMCVTDNYIVFAVINGNENDNTYLYIVNKTDYSLVNKITNYCFEHANSLTYNKDNNTIVIAHCVNNSVQSNNISIVDASLLSTPSPIDFVINTFEFQYAIQSIVYYNNKYYLIKNDQKTVFVTDNNFTTISTFSLKDNAIVQGVEIHNELIFISKVNTEYGQINNDVINTGIIEVYDLNGNYIKKWLVPLDILGSEIEGFHYLRDGKFISNFNGSRHYFYISTVYDVNSEYTLVEVPYYYKNNTKYSTIYVDSTYIGLVSNGTQQYPLKTLNELTFYLKKTKLRSNITVYLKGIFDENWDLTDIKNTIFINSIDNTLVPIKSCHLNSSIYVAFNGIHVNGSDNNGYAVFVEGGSSLSITNCKIEYTHDANIPNAYTPIYSIGSKIIFDNGNTEINGAKGYVINAVHSLVHISNGITGTNIVGVRLKASTMYVTSTHYNIGNTLLTLETGGQILYDSTDSGWITATLSSNFDAYNSLASNTPRYRRIGKIVSIRGLITPSTTASIVAGTTTYKIFDLPTGFRPSVHPVSTICQGSGNYIWFLSIEADGGVYFSRYRIGDTNAVPSNGTYLPFSISFMLD